MVKRNLHMEQHTLIPILIYSSDFKPYDTGFLKIFERPITLLPIIIGLTQYQLPAPLPYIGLLLEFVTEHESLP